MNPKDILQLKQYNKRYIGTSMKKDAELLVQSYG